MDLRQLNYFATVARLGSFSRAAEHLHVAQPALSRHIRLLETEVGMALLNRHGRGVDPTLAGAILLKHALQIISAVDRAKQDLAAVADKPIGTIRLGVPPAISGCLTAELLDDLKHRYPQLSLKITERWTGHIRELLLERQLDFGVLSETQLNRRFEHVTLVSEPVCLVRSARTAGSRRPIRLENLSKIPLVVPPCPHGSRLVLDQALKRSGLKANIVLESEVWSVIKDVVQKGIACTLVPRREVLDELKKGALRAEPLQKPGIRHTIALARVVGRRRIPFEDDVFHSLSTHLQNALRDLNRRGDNDE